MGLGIVLVSEFSGAPVFAEDKPIEDGSKITITTPKHGDKISDSFELKYELTKGKHQIAVTGANKDHKLVSATQTITVEVQ